VILRFQAQLPQPWAKKVSKRTAMVVTWIATFPFGRRVADDIAVDDLREFFREAI
jgi:hypothetical protein